MGAVLVAIALLADGPTWAVVAGSVIALAGAFAALYFFTDARPVVRRPERPTPAARLPYCPYCGRPQRPTGAFCHTCGGRA
jgi:hypothetical protein